MEQLLDVISTYCIQDQETKIKREQNYNKFLADINHHKDIAFEDEKRNLFQIYEACVKGKMLLRTLTYSCTESEPGTFINFVTKSPLKFNIWKAGSMTQLARADSNWVMVQTEQAQTKKD